MPRSPPSLLNPFQDHRPREPAKLLLDSLRIQLHDITPEPHSLHLPVEPLRLLHVRPKLHLLPPELLEELRSIGGGELEPCRSGPDRLFPHFLSTPSPPPLRTYL